jgi:hypothetical protein
VTGYELDDRMIGFRFPAEVGDFSLHHRVQTGLLSNGYRGLFPWEVERPGHEADHSPASSAVELYLHSPIRLHGVVLS